MGKRAFDFILSVVGLVVLSPLLIYIAWAIKWDSPGPVFYRGVRVGRFGKLFRILKFRTMVVNAEQLGSISVADDDVRITRVGRYLRKYKLDELPQLMNVVKGEMSLVGPRPDVPQCVALFNDEERAILSVRPGITDWASIWNPNEDAALLGAVDPDKTYLDKIRPEKIRLQLQYVRQRSFWTDIVVLMQTGVVLLIKRPGLHSTTLIGAACGDEFTPKRSHHQGGAL